MINLAKKLTFGSTVFRILRDFLVFTLKLLAAATLNGLVTLLIFLWIARLRGLEIPFF